MTSQEQRDQEQRDRFAEIAFAELCKKATHGIFDSPKVLSADDVKAIIKQLGNATYKFADAAMSARAKKDDQ